MNKYSTCRKASLNAKLPRSGLIDVSPWLYICHITLDNLVNIYRCDWGPVETLLFIAKNEWKATIAYSFLEFSTHPYGK